MAEFEAPVEQGGQDDFFNPAEEDQVYTNFLMEEDTTAASNELSLMIHTKHTGNP